MNELVDAIGTAGEGALLARTAEPVAGETHGHADGSACLNCGAALVGPHCHACGQSAHIHRTLGAFFHDLLHGVLHFEGKTWRTLPLLAWQPGKLTREYIDGRRASYVSPIALFLFIVFLSYALFSFLGSPLSVKPDAAGVTQAHKAYAEMQTELKTLQTERAAAPDGSAQAQELDRKIADATESQNALGAAINAVDSGFEQEMVNNVAGGSQPASNRLTKAIEHIRANPQLVIYKAQTSAYKYSWMLIPLSVPFVWLLFPFSRRFAAYDHTVFSTYSITFMIALVAVVSLLFYVNQWTIGSLLLLYAPFHMYRHLRGAYALDRWGAIWRMLALSLFAWVVLTLFAMAITAMVA